MPLLPLLRIRRALLTAGLWLTIAAPLAFGGFTATLTSAEKAALGLDVLSAEESAALDKLVAEDLALARRENLTELAGSFVNRRDEISRKEAGLDRLTAEQLARLNERIAAAIANRPVPRERPRLKDNDVLIAKKRGEVHGSVTFAYGWGGGREFRAGSLWLDYYDPENRFGLGVGITTVDGDGFYGYPGYYPGRYRSYGGPFYPNYFYPDFSYHDIDHRAGPPLFLSANFLDARGGFFPDAGDCFRPLPAALGGRGGRRR